MLSHVVASNECDLTHQADSMQEATGLPSFVTLDHRKEGKMEQVNTRSLGLLCWALLLFFGVGSAHAQTAQEIAKKAFGSTVLLVMEDANGQPLSLGSGFFVRNGELDRRGVVKDNHGMMHVSVEDIQQNLIVYLQRVEAGETLVIIRAGQPVVEMKPVKTGAETLRPFGLCAGEFTVPEDFDAPLPEDLLQAFEGL